MTMERKYDTVCVPKRYAVSEIDAVRYVKKNYGWSTNFSTHGASDKGGYWKVMYSYDHPKY